MGNRLILNPQIPQINIAEWEIVEHQTNENCDYGQFQVLRNKASHDLIQEYELVFVDADDFKIYLQSFVWRLREPKIVRTMYLAENHKKQLCSITYSAKVYIQHIKIRLSDIRDIPFPENLYIAVCMLQGYGKLYQHTSQFQIQQNQVCVDDNGHVKVWINSDLSKNYPLYGQEGLSYSSEEMVEDIIRIVAENTDQETEPYPLDQYFEEHKQVSQSFQDAKILISQYARQFGTKIPHRFDSILEIYGDKDFNSQEEQSPNEQQHQDQQLESAQHDHQNMYEIKNLKQQNINHRNAKSNSARKIQLQQKHIRNVPYQSRQQYSNSKNYVQSVDSRYLNHQKNLSNIANPTFTKIPSVPSHQGFHFNSHNQTNQIYIPKQRYIVPNNFRSQYISTQHPIYYRNDPIQHYNYPIRIQPNVMRAPYIPPRPIPTYIVPNYHSFQYRQTMPPQIYQNNFSPPIKRVNSPDFQTYENSNTKKQQKREQIKLPSFIQSQKIAPLYIKSEMQKSENLSQSQIIKQQQKIIQQQKQELKRLQYLKSIERQPEKKESNIFKASHQKKIHKQVNQSPQNHKNVERYKAFYYTLSSEQELDPEIAADLQQIQMNRANL